MSWEIVRLGDILNYEQPTSYIVESDSYDNSYSTPVLTAGKSFILGYTNESNGVYKNLPAIIFDDFTTVSKYVDFKFKVKSSAMKILTCDTKRANLRFLYYLLQTINFNAEQHKRYWISTYANFEIQLPPIETQKRIVDILDAADALKQKDQELLKKYDELAQAIFIDMFGDPVRNEKGWEVKSLNSVTNKITDGEHGTVERINSGYPYLMARNIRDGYIDFTDIDFISENDHKRIFKRCNPEMDDLLLVCVGATIGRVCLMPTMEEFSLARSVALIKPNKKYLNPKFLYFLFKTEYIQRQIKASNNSSAQAGLYTGKIKELEIILPPRSLQEKFEIIVNSLIKQKLVINPNISDMLNNTLIQKAFKGELIA
jgi:type I restriction enzyme S subunit